MEKTGKNGRNNLNNSINIPCLVLSMCFLLVGINFYASAQIVEEDISAAVLKPPDPFIRFDSKNSFISNNGVKIWGLNLGLNYSDTFKYGFGLYGLSTPLKRDFYEMHNGIRDTIHSELNYTYLALFGEYVFYQTKHWEGSLPIQIGVGGTSFSGNANDSTYVYHPKLVMHYEATLTGHYRFLRYFAVGGGIGYRIMLIDNKPLDLQLTSPIYILKLKFFIGDVYRDVKALF
ncbi:MAG: hypothetical protein PF590_05240 [Candidatus Delongbacteria bacterium]|jgi:hypothetical protein|nr:hypothetical protein [Candidatus Delongbacteria bacterium]